MAQASEGEAGSVYEWLVREDGGGWQHWRERVPAWVYPAAQERPRFAQLIIPTLDSVRYQHLLGLVFAAGGVRATPARAASMSVQGLCPIVVHPCVSEIDVFRYLVLLCPAAVYSLWYALYNGPCRQQNPGSWHKYFF